MDVSANTLVRPLSAAALLAFGLLVSSGVAAQESTTAWQPPRMAWGDPDLQGTWTTATITGLERMDDVEKLVLSAAEVRQIEQGSADFMASIDDVPEGDLAAGKNVGGYNSFWMDPGKHLARVNGEARSSLIVEPKDGKLPYRIRAYARLMKVWWTLDDADNPETRLLGERCIVGFGSTGGPPMLPVLYNNHYQIVQAPGFVMILVEMNHDVRMIRMNAERLPAAIQPWLGDSIGHWEGDTLVVETTQFNPGQSFRGSLRHALFISPDALVTERFTRKSEREILYEFSVDDPHNYSSVWRAEVPMLTSDGKIYEYACHEGNYSMLGILRGARAEEQE